LPAALRLAAQRAFIASESFLLPAAVSPPLFLPGALALAAGALVVVPFRLAQRAFAAAASFARVAGDIGLRLRERRRLVVAPPELVELVEEPPPPKIEDNRRSSVLIWFLIERASVSLLRDKSIGPLDSSVRNNCKRNTTIT
jgi:hypothetical protein